MNVLAKLLLFVGLVGGLLYLTAFAVFFVAMVVTTL